MFQSYHVAESDDKSLLFCLDLVQHVSKKYCETVQSSYTANLTYSVLMSYYLFVSNLLACFDVYAFISLLAWRSYADRE